MAANTPLVRVKDVYKKFSASTINEMEVFQDYSLEIQTGQFVAIVGSNGSGKTTLLNLICGSIPVDAGKIYLKDTEITKLPAFRRAAGIGRVYQNPAAGTCPSLTILENMSLADNKGKAFGLARGVNKKRLDFYQSRLRLLRMGLEDKVHLQAGVLSGGQRQALALLIATLTPIDLLVLDEHTAALDPNSSETVMELTEQLVGETGVTTIMVTHNLRYAIRYGNRLIMMHKGSNVIDAADEEKQALDVNDLLGTFNEISIECGN